MFDICNGTVIIEESCEYPVLAHNGTLLFFTDITIKFTAYERLRFFDQEFYISFNVLSEAHKMLSDKLVEESMKLEDSLKQLNLNIILIWIFVCLGISVVYGQPIVGAFLAQIDETKSMLTLIPISIVKEQMPIRRYLKKIEKKNRDTFWIMISLFLLYYIPADINN